MPQFDFETGTWSSGQSVDATLIIAGDWAPIRKFVPLIEKDPASIYGDLLPIIQNADLSLVNLEAPLSDHGSPVTKSGAVFKGDACHVKGLTAVPFDGVTLANNHMFDFGLNAFKETLKILDANGIKHVGAGYNLDQASTPCILKTRGITLGIINLSEGEDLTAAGQGPGVMGWDIPIVESRVRELKQTVDAVIVIAHCGLEYIPFAPPYVMDAFKKLADTGAHAVIGHHPHVPQGVTIHNGVPICCSLGNFVFYQPTDLHWRKLGYMAQLGLSKKGVVSMEIIPYRIHDKGLSSLAAEQKQRFFKGFQDISQPLDTPQGIEDAWNGFLSYYGSKGFKNEVTMIMEKLEKDPGKGAAMFRNRLTTSQHFFHWKDLLTRMVSGQLETGPEWAQDLAREWLNRTRKTPGGSLDG